MLRLSSRKGLALVMMAVLLGGKLPGAVHWAHALPSAAQQIGAAAHVEHEPCCAAQPVGCAVACAAASPCPLMFAALTVVAPGAFDFCDRATCAEPGAIPEGTDPLTESPPPRS